MAKSWMGIGYFGIEVVEVDVVVWLLLRSAKCTPNVDGNC
jgi:hypothetical protein